VTTLEGYTERDIAKAIDHSLLRPELDDAFVEDGCRLAAEYDVASVCVRPADVVRATAILRGSDVAVGTTIGFPHGNHLTRTKVFEARQALGQGATELDMVLLIGALRSGRDEDVRSDIAAVVEVAHAEGAIVKVIFENAYLSDDEKVRACHLSEAAGADFVKTSTGKVQPAATLPVTLVMLEAVRDFRSATGRLVGVKPAGGIRTTKDAIKYLVLVNETVGDDWLHPDRFRFGASTLLNDLLMQRTKLATGRYSGPDYFTLD
jgi:deoxyribose-phosphate aldolase